MKQQGRKGLRTWIEIDTKSLAHNYKVLRDSLSPKCKLMSVAKSNAYGHSLVDFSREIEKLGTDWIGVDSIVEAIALRENGIKVPILVLGYTLPEMLSKATELDVSVTVSTFETLNAIYTENLGGKIKVHIKIDTGMHRQGFQYDEMLRVIDELKKLAKDEKIEIEGLFTHFASAKNPSFTQNTFAQIALFEKWVESFAQAGFDPIKHACASGGALIFSKAHFDMVRIGISMYGLYPSKEVESFSKNKIVLKPILAWKTIVGEVKNVPKGDRVGYDFTEEFQRDSKIAICPIGYWHGYSRYFSSVAHVLVRGKKVRVIGRVSMDMVTIDVTDVKDVCVGDVVTLIGNDGDETISLEYLADLTDNSLYEIVTRLNPLIKRIYV
jgi:alanine racemase